MDQTKIGRFIAAMRREHGMTQRELAEAMNLSNRTISKWECGDGLPELANVLPLCELLGVTSDELLRGEHRYKTIPIARVAVGIVSHTSSQGFDLRKRDCSRTNSDCLFPQRSRRLRR